MFDKIYILLQNTEVHCALGLLLIIPALMIFIHKFYNVYHNDCILSKDTSDKSSFKSKDRKLNGYRNRKNKRR